MERSRLQAAWKVTDAIATTLLLVGAAGAIADWRAGAWLMVAGVALAVGGHVVVGVLDYRATFRRPWPVVPPVVDDD
jgi:hypothetical protein